MPGFRRLRNLVLASGLLGMAAGVSGCGGHHRAAAKVPPETVPVALVPSSLEGGTYTVSEDVQARKEFANIGSSALITDGRLWGIRRGSQLVATLQLSTLKPNVGLAKASQRQAIVRQIVSGSSETVTEHSVDIAENANANETIFVWFGQNLMEVLQVKLSQENPTNSAALLKDIIGFETASPEWHGLPADKTAD